MNRRSFLGHVAALLPAGRAIASIVPIKELPPPVFINYWLDEKFNGHYVRTMSFIVRNHDEKMRAFRWAFKMLGKVPSGHRRASLSVSETPQFTESGQKRFGTELVFRTEDIDYSRMRL